MENVLIQARVSPVLKQQAEQLFAGMGLSLSEAVRVFLQQSVNEHGLPFQPRLRMPNAETLAAIEELDNDGGKKVSLKEFAALLEKIAK